MSSPQSHSPAGGSGEGMASPTPAQMSLQLREITQMLQQRSDELSSLRREHAALKATSEANATRVTTLESELAGAAGTNGDSSVTELLRGKDAEIASLKAKSNELINKLERLESESVVIRKRAEVAASKVAEEKDEEITALKEMFTQVSEKRKESFLALKEKLRQASEMLAKNAEQHAADQARIVELVSSLDEAQKQLRERVAQVSDFERRVHMLEHEKGDLFQRTSNELAQSQKEVRERNERIEALQKQLDEASVTARFLAEKDTAQAKTDLALESDVAENGRPVLAQTSLPRDTPIQWYRSFRGSCFVKIPGGEGLTQAREYVPTVDDIGAVLKCEMMIGEAANIPVSREFGPVGSRKAMVVAIHESIKKQEVVFNVESAYQAQPKDDKEAKALAKNKPQILLNREKIKLRAGGKTIAKAEWSDQLRVTLDTESSTRFTVRVDAAATPISYAAPNGVERDLIVQTIRSFNQAMQMLTQQVRDKTAPSDAIYSLAYLIRTTNEQRQIATLKSQGLLGPQGSGKGSAGGGVGGGSDAPRKSSLSDNDGFGFMAATGVHAGAHSQPSTPNNAAAAARGGMNLDTPHSNVGGSSFTPAKKPEAAPVAVGKIKGSNGEELEIDADGFVIRRDHERGWGDEPERAPKRKATAGAAAVGAGAPASGAEKQGEGAAAGTNKAEGGGEGEDSGFSDEEEEEEAKPAIRVQINAEARPLASGESLRKSVVDFGLVPSGRKGAKAAKKEEKKAKKEKKKKDKSGGDGEIQSPLGIDVARNGVVEGGEGAGAAPPQEHTPRSVNAVGSNAASSVPPGGAAPLSSPPSVEPGSSVVPAASPGRQKQLSVNPDDLFAFLDSEAATKAPPSLGGSVPTPLAVDLQAASAAKPPPPPFAPAPSPRSSAPRSAEPSPSVQSGPLAQAVVPAAAAPSPLAASGLSRQVSSGDNQVDILVMETIHARMMDGEVIEYAVWGEVLLNLSTPPSSSVRFDFQIFNTDQLTKVTPNASVLSGGQGGAWIAQIPAGTDAPLCVMKYKVVTDLAAAKKQVPLALQVQWQCARQSTTIDVDYRLVQTPVRMPLSDLKFLIAIAPDKCIRQCQLAVPKCMYSPASQKMMWQIPNLPTLDTNATSGHLHAELVNADIEAQPSPLSVNFMSEDLEGVISGILVMEGDRPANARALGLGRLIYRVKSGIFTVL